MKRILFSKNKEIYFIVFLIILLVISRFFNLNEFPVGLTHDETVYAIQAKSLAIQNSNTEQNLGWFSLKPIHSMYAEWPASLMAPFFWVTDNPILATHLLPTVMGILLPLGLAWLVWGLWRDQKLALISLALAIFSPLLWQFSRLSFDSFFSVFFYVWAGALLINLKDWQKMWAIPVLIVGFFQYQGLKLLLVPWVFTLCSLQFVAELKDYRWKSFIKQSKKYLSRPISIILYFSVILTLVYGFIILPGQDTNGRISKTIVTDNQFISQQVNTQRRLSIQTSVSKVFANKFTQIGLFIIKNYAGAFSPELLFIQSEPTVSGFAVWSHGVFYIVDIVLLALGFFVLMKNKKTQLQGLILLLMPIIFSLPSIINTLSEWYLLRQMLAYTSMMIVMAWGGWYLLQFNKLKWLLFSVYLISISNFVYQYYFRYPVYSADAQEVQERIISKYISLVKKDNSEQLISVYTPEPERYFASYLLYSNKLNQQTKDDIADSYKTGNYQLDGVTFVSGCVDLNQDEVIIGDILSLPCDVLGSDAEAKAKEDRILSNKLSIPAVLDSGETFRIYNDQICSKYQLPTFFSVSNLEKFQVENMTAQNFCQSWIADLNQLTD